MKLEKEGIPKIENELWTKPEIDFQKEASFFDFHTKLIENSMPSLRHYYQKKALGS